MPPSTGKITRARRDDVVRPSHAEGLTSASSPYRDQTRGGWRPELDDRRIGDDGWRSRYRPVPAYARILGCRRIPSASARTWWAAPGPSCRARSPSSRPDCTVRRLDVKFSSHRTRIAMRPSIVVFAATFRRSPRPLPSCRDPNPSVPTTSPADGHRRVNRPRSDHRPSPRFRWFVVSDDNADPRFRSLGAATSPPGRSSTRLIWNGTVAPYTTGHEPRVIRQRRPDPDECATDDPRVHVTPASDR